MSQKRLFRRWVIAPLEEQCCKVALRNLTNIQIAQFLSGLSSPVIYYNLLREILSDRELFTRQKLSMLLHMWPWEELTVNFKPLYDHAFIPATPVTVAYNFVELFLDIVKTNSLPKLRVIDLSSVALSLVSVAAFLDKRKFQESLHTGIHKLPNNLRYVCVQKNSPEDFGNECKNLYADLSGVSSVSSYTLRLSYQYYDSFHSDVTHWLLKKRKYFSYVNDVVIDLETVSLFWDGASVNELLEAFENGPEVFNEINKTLEEFAVRVTLWPLAGSQGINTLCYTIPRFTNLTKLVLKSEPLQGKLCQILNATSGLRCLELHKCSLSAADLIALSQLPHVTSLKELRLIENNFRNCEKELSNILAGAKFNLEYLSLASCCLTPEVAEGVLDSLMDCESLIMLDISGYQLFNIEDVEDKIVNLSRLQSLTSMLITYYFGQFINEETEQKTVSLEVKLNRRRIEKCLETGGRDCPRWIHLTDVEWTSFFD